MRLFFIVAGSLFALTSCSEEKPGPIVGNDSNAADQVPSGAQVSLADLEFNDRGQVTCIAPGMNREEQFCGHQCPAGYSFVSYNPNTPASCKTQYVDGCDRIANLYNHLGWHGGHKSRFCRSRGYNGVINKPGSDYKENWGGWCYKGDQAACQASLPDRGYGLAFVDPDVERAEALSEATINWVLQRASTSGACHIAPVPAKPELGVVITTKTDRRAICEEARSRKSEDVGQTDRCFAYTRGARNECQRENITLPPDA